MTVENVKRTIANINQDLSLQHQVTLGSSTKNKTRIGEFFKKKFNSAKYKDYNELSTLNVIGKDYFILCGKTYYKDTDGKSKVMEESVFISYPHLIKIKLFLEEALEWLISEDYADMFVEFENSTILSDKYLSLSRTISGLALDKKLEIFPTVLQENDVFYESVGISLNGKIDVFLTVDELRLLIHLFSTIDLYSSSLMLMALKNIEGLKSIEYSSTSNNYYQKKNSTKESIASIANRRKRALTKTEEE